MNHLLPRFQIRVVDKVLTDGGHPVVEVLKDGVVMGLLPAREVRLRIRPGHFALAEVDLDCTVQSETVKLSPPKPAEVEPVLWEGD